MPLLPLKLQALGLLAPAHPPYYGAGDHLEEEALRRYRRRRQEEDILVLYGAGELSLSEANALLKV